MNPALLAALLVVAAPPKVRPTASALVLTAQTEFNRGDFQAALKTLESVTSETTDDSVLARAHLLRGQIYGAQRDLVRAEEAFADALEHDPDAKLDPSRVDPSLVTLLEDLRHRLEGQLHIQADRPGAKVAIDGHPLGEAPISAKVAIGKHTITAVSADGQYAGEGQTVVRPRHSVDLSLAMAPVSSGEPPSKGPAAGTKVDDADSMAVPGWGHPYAGLRLAFDPLQYAEGPAIEISGGFEQGYLHLGANARVFPVLGLTPQISFGVPVSDRVRVFSEFEVPVLYQAQHFAVGISAGGGVEYFINKWISLYGSLDSQYYFLAVVAPDSRFTLHAGSTLRLP